MSVFTRAGVGRQGPGIRHRSVRRPAAHEAAPVAAALRAGHVGRRAALAAQGNRPTVCNVHSTRS